jgi:hypothetical protein
MTASEFYQTEWPSLIVYESMSDSEIIELIARFALLKCAEQRQICADNAELAWDEYNEIYIDKNSILNQPSPKM